ncbi:3-deoxy-D-manno-octulosonic acid transferase, partial [bacterium]|nr:3-deoxy-D-manno-octulosonic acid transferase [bacterium]
MRIIWAIVTGILALPALLVTLIVASRDERWADGLVERLGQIHPHFGKGRLLVQAASVGEVATAAPLIDALNAELGPGALVLSTMTPTGNAEAKRRWP